MSWCRFGSRCWDTVVLYACDRACGSECPGSDLYIYENQLREFGDPEDVIVCCNCRLNDCRDFIALSREAMQDHVEEHVVAGHHVRPSIRAVLCLDEAELGVQSLEDILSRPRPSFADLLFPELFPKVKP